MHNIAEDIRRIELELIDVETRLEKMGTLDRSYSTFNEKREILVKQLEFLKGQMKVHSSTPATSKATQARGPTQSEIVKKRVDELRKADPDKSVGEILDEVADELGKSLEAVKASYYRTTKDK
jgi:hypothetical protein